MGAGASAFLIPGLPSCYGGSWPMVEAAREANNSHLAAAAAGEPLLLLACNRHGCGLVHLAAKRGHLSTLKLLLEVIAANSARLSARLQEVLSRYGDSYEILRRMSRSTCQRKQFLRLLQPDQVLPTLLSWQDSRGITPLMLAARGGHTSCLTLLLAHGADPLLLDNINRRSCLHYAAACGHVSCVDALLNAFQTVPQQQVDGNSEPRPRLVLVHDATMIDGYRGSTSFVDLRTRSGFSALHYAAYWGFKGCVRALLTAGASVTKKAAGKTHTELPVIPGSTALHLAAENGHTAVAALLLHAQVLRMSHVVPRQLESISPEQLPWEGSPRHDPRMANNDAGDTPLRLASAQRHSEDLLLLLLDATVPISWTLRHALQKLDGPSRFGVPSLAVLAKSALDQHLASMLDKLDMQHNQIQRHNQQQQQQQQQQEQQEQEQLERQQELQLGLQVQPRQQQQQMLQEEPLAAQQQHQHNDPHDNEPCPALPQGLLATWPVGACRASSALHDTLQACQNPPEAQLPAAAIASISSSTAAAAHSASCSSLSSLSSTSSSSSNGINSVCSSSSSGSLDDLASCHCDEDQCCAGGSEHPVEDRSCQICFDATADVMLEGCCHCLCSSCARSLVIATTINKPACCPFCRAGMRGFVAATVCALSR